MTRRGLRRVGLLSILIIGLTGGLARAQPSGGPENDLMELTVEELLRVNVLNLNAFAPHTHLASQWMIGYRGMMMGMDGTRAGTRRIAANEVLQNFVVAPTSMRMEMQMVNLMYAPTDSLTVMVMPQYLRLSMDHLTRMGTRFTTESSGLGDTRAEVLYNAYGDVRRLGHRIIVGAGVSLPTGSTEERGDTPAGRNQLLPYPMQLGSGTFDLLPSIVYLGQTASWAWSSQADASLRLGTNSSDYALGDRLHFTAWGSRKLNRWVAVSSQVEGQIWGNIDGANPGLNPAMVPTADPTLRGGKRVDVSLGMDFYVAGDALGENRLGVRFNVPAYESFDGPQLESTWHLEIGWNVTF